MLWSSRLLRTSRLTHIHPCLVICEKWTAESFSKAKYTVSVSLQALLTSTPYNVFRDNWRCWFGHNCRQVWLQWKKIHVSCHSIVKAHSRNAVKVKSALNNHFNLRFCKITFNYYGVIRFDAVESSYLKGFYCSSLFCVLRARDSSSFLCGNQLENRMWPCLHISRP